MLTRKPQLPRLEGMDTQMLGEAARPAPGTVRDLTGEEHRIGKEMYQVVQARSSDCERLGALTNT